MPTYVPPKPSDFKPQLDNKLSPEVASRLKVAASPSHPSRGNHVVNNIRGTRARSPHRLQ